MRIYYHPESSPVPFGVLYLLSEGATRLITQSSGIFLCAFCGYSIQLPMLKIKHPVLIEARFQRTHLLYSMKTKREISREQYT